MKTFPFARPCACLVFFFIYSSITLLIWLMVNSLDSHVSPAVDFEIFTIEGLGELGNESRLEMTKQDFLESENMFAQYEYNAWLSEKIPLKRSLRDYRDPRCLNASSGSEISITASIIIAHNMEHPQTLLRTLFSIQMRTPADLIKEIILVHDGLGDRNLWEYISYKLPLVTQLEVGITKPKGLIQARLTGARKATGDVLVFLNAHMEVTEGWLPPLLTPISENQKTATQSITDTVSTETFAYEELVEPKQMGFNWQLDRIPLPLEQSHRNRWPCPYAASQVEGHVIAINRQWFWHLGGWDEGFEDNGGDALELSLKAWQCGGRVLTVPCSRIGQVLKRSEAAAQMSPNLNPDKSVRRNFKRVVEVWFEIYKLHVYRYSPRLRNISVGSLTRQHNLRRRLQCKSFEWYKSQVIPSYSNHYLKGELSNYAVGQIMPFVAPHYCLSLSGRSPILRKCTSTSFGNWTLTPLCQLKYGKMCLKIGKRNKVLASKCSKTLSDHPWTYNYQHQAFVSRGKKCLQIDVEKVELISTSCDAELKEQRWMYTGVSDSNLNNLMDLCLNIN